VVTAGHILLKHPDYTHRTYYMMSLRRAIPATTPFFDIGIAYTTPHGEKIPHLTVKCGSNHVTALAEVLSAHLDGQKTNALFLATSMIQTMTTEEAHGLFATHKHFLASIQRLPLFPQVINIDRIRTEYTSTNKTMERSTRDWATGLRSKDTQQLLRCDAENGGKDKRAYLLVPTVFLEQVKLEYERYKLRLKQSNQPWNPNSQPDSGTSADRPQEIYVPTAAVLKNLQFMQNMSSESIWRAAPPSVRQTRAEAKDANTQMIAAAASDDRLTMRAYPIAQLHQHQQGERETQSKDFRQINRNNAFGTQKQQSPPDEATTVCTTQSPLTRYTQTQSTISILEETIQKQQQEIQTMLRRSDAMDTKMDKLTTAIKTGELNQNNTIIHIQQQLDTVCDSLKFLVQQSTGTKTQSHQPTQIQTGNTQRVTDEQQRQLVGLPVPTNTMIDGGGIDEMQVDTAPTRTRSPMGKSPEKKKQRSTAQSNNHLEIQMELYKLKSYNTPHQQDEENSQLTDQSGAQYTNPSPSDGGQPG
jgi:hypothetical protein